MKTEYVHDADGKVTEQRLPLYRLIASTCGALRRCEERGMEFAANHSALLDYIDRNILPSGSGIDSGTTIDREKSNDGRIVLKTSFHHMNDNGMYDGWTEHTVTVSPSFTGINVAISGRNRNDIKDYLADVFDHALTSRVRWYAVDGESRVEIVAECADECQDSDFEKKA